MVVPGSSPWRSTPYVGSGMVSLSPVNQREPPANSAAGGSTELGAQKAGCFGAQSAIPDAQCGRSVDSVPPKLAASGGASTPRSIRAWREAGSAANRIRSSSTVWRTPQLPVCTLHWLNSTASGVPSTVRWYLATIAFG